MANIWERLFGRGEDANGTGKQAKSRLQFVLLHDRMAIAPEKMEEMKAEILEVIKKYLTVDSAQFDIALQRRESASLLVAEVPFLRMEAANVETDIEETSVPTRTRDGKIVTEQDRDDA
ncbi:MAG: cell division topological specificity factor MinE [Chloroflexota bacterium]|nr:cell division topological specificity factor MinE [Chloroflexota bacterium]